MTPPAANQLDVDFLGQSEAFLAFGERLSRAAAVDRPVLIIGERGTGKELAAARLHYLSPRWGQALIALNCAALAPGLIESELFGHEAGAFTGAVGRRQGRFETADGGSLFLDEIGAAPLEVQEKILRAVEYGVFERVGGTRPVEVDVRIIGATNADLIALADQGRFKPDLLDRLSFEVLIIPPLRHRGGDIELLAGHFADRMARELGRAERPCFTDRALAELQAHPWPGNVRELKNVVERAVYRTDGPEIDRIDFDPFASPYAVPPADRPEAPPAASPPSPPTPTEVRPFKAAVADYEVELIRAALAQARFNQAEAARSLDLSYDQFRGLYRKYCDRLAD